MKSIKYLVLFFWMSLELVCSGQTTGDRLTGFAWRDDPISIDGISLDDSPATVLSQYGPPEKISLVGSTEPGIDAFLWEYPEKKVAIFKGSVVGVEGNTLQAGDVVLIAKGEDRAIDWDSSGFTSEANGERYRKIRFKSRWEGGNHLRTGLLTLSQANRKISRIVVTNPTWLDSDFRMASTATPPKLPSLKGAFKDSVLVEFLTSKGSFNVEVYPEANPEVVKRFLSLVRSGFYDGIPIHSVWSGFGLDFGINWREPYRAEATLGSFKANSLPSYSLEPGTVAFWGHTGVTINTQDLTGQSVLWPTVIGRVVKGWPSLEKLEAFGPVDPVKFSQSDRLWTEGQRYLDEIGEGKQAVMILSVKIASQP